MADNRELHIEAEEGKGYALSGKIMLSAIVILFGVVVFMVGLHLYARWYLIRLRRRQIARRQQRRMGRTQIVIYAADRGLPSSVVDRGLELAVLNSLPVSLYSGKAEELPPECAVCLSEFEEREIVRLLPKCNHSFHIECIDMWFNSHSTCPLCRSPVERVVGRDEPVVKPIEPAEEGNGVVAEPGSSSGSSVCDDDKTSLGGRRKGAELLGVRIEVPPRRVELENELPQSSPASRLLSFRRILSMGRRSPAAASSGGGGATTPCGAGSSHVINELDLESGAHELTPESSRVNVS
ncbi:hypothetical protein ACS0TY_027295 [Phlomoides rotata]